MSFKRASRELKESIKREKRVGEKVGKSMVDKYGDAVMNKPLPGDYWRVRDKHTYSTSSGS